MSLKINKQYVDELEFTSTGQKIYRDSELTGFYVRVTSNSKTFIVDKKFNNRLYRIVIGSLENITVSGARKKAQIILAQIYSGQYEHKMKSNVCRSLVISRKTSNAI